MRSRCLTLTLAALLAALATACQRPEPTTPAATLAEAAPTDLAEPEPTQPPPPPVDYSVPEVIDAAYAQRVVQTLYSLESEAARDMKLAGAVTERAEAILRAIYVPEQIEFRLRAAQQAVDQGFPGVREAPGDQQLTVENVVSGDQDCALIAAYRDFSEVRETPSELEGLTYVHVLLKAEGSDPQGINPTPWMIAGAERRPDGSVPEDPCAA